jgi:16S rRNA (cytosine967-C5)-methyltransferase
LGDRDRSAPPARVPAGVRTRLAAAVAVQEVLGEGRSLDEALGRHLTGLQDPRDRGLVREIAYGVLRYLPRLQRIALDLLRRPFKARDRDLECLLLAGLYQLLYLRLPAHAAVSQTVGAARPLGKAWASGLLNGSLRAFQRRRQELLDAIAGDPQARYCFPAWLLERLRQAWPGHWQQVVEASNGRPPMALRVNQARVSRDDYLKILSEAGLSARPLVQGGSGVVLDRALAVDALPGFAQGLVSVQDGAAQLAAPLLAPAAGMAVLDACAAPGGKSAHLLELAPAAELTAVDVSVGRLRPLRENLARLGLAARVLAADVSDPDGAWADRHYQRILLDVPCSATGVIRRHPDIKWLRRDTDIAPLVQRQAAILDSVWQRLAPGGILAYVTCSVLPEENQQQMQAFLQRTPDARELAIDAAWGRACRHGRQVLPGDEEMDGFFFARLVREAPWMST